MEFLRAVGRFLLMQIVILSFLMLAPAIMVGASIFAITGHAGTNAGFLAFFYFAAGPFVSGVWTMIVLQVRKAYRVRVSTGAPYKTDLNGHLSAWGWLAYGFFGTLAAEVAFYFAFSAVSKSVTAFFVMAPFVVFLPLIAWLVLGGGLKGIVRRLQYDAALRDYARVFKNPTRPMNSFEVWSSIRDKQAFSN